MRSKYESLREKATQMRKHGASLLDVSAALGIPKSTLSYWFKDIQLSPVHMRALQKRHKAALVTARKGAVKWHNAQKAKRLQIAEDAAGATLQKIDTSDDAMIELTLSLLYLGEGMKKSNMTSMGNSDPLILKFFVTTLQRLYQIPTSAIKCELHLRADQDANAMIEYWSKTLGIPRNNFGKTNHDMRTKGRPTYAHYKGVCIVRCSRVAIQRKLVYIATKFCTQIAEQSLRA